MRKVKIISMLLSMAILLSACGGATSSKVEKEPTNKNAVFKEERGIFPLEEGDLTQLLVHEDTLYVEQYIYTTMRILRQERRLW